MKSAPTDALSILESMIIKRSWSERYFSWPWRPWVRYRAPEFKPCVISHGTLGFTEVILEDTTMVWCPVPIPGTPGHVVDVAYNTTGNLVGMRVWASLETRNDYDKLRTRLRPVA